MNNPINDIPIDSLSLSNLIDLAGDNKREGLMRECAAKSDMLFQPYHTPRRIDAFIIGVVTENEATISLNLREYKLAKDSLFIFSPQSLLRVNQGIHCKADIIAVSPDFIQRINIDMKNLIPLFIQYGENPCLMLTPEESLSMRSLIAQAERETAGPETPFAFDIIRGLLFATVYKVGDILHHYLTSHPEIKTLSHNRAEEYFKQFARLLAKHYREERSVGFYARQLCITPKYLTTLIKRISNLSVSGWIDNYVIMEAKALLKHSTMSIQEIAYYLNFPNQSFFGSYFKRNTGLSPSQYKVQN